jgi:RES domain-containing protein
MSESLAAAVARAPIAEATGLFYRHTSLKRVALTGYPVGGRWAPPNAFPVLYLGRPAASVVVEAYRHLVDQTEGMTGGLVGPRQFLTCELSVSNVVDLRSREARELVGFTEDEMTSGIGDYDACQRVAAKAHQLGRHGVLAPAATGMGETLALFTGRMPASEMPTLVQSELWERLPRDPRRLELLQGEGG